MISYRNYFNGFPGEANDNEFNGCLSQDAPHPLLHAAVLRAHCVDDERNFISNPWIAQVCLEFLEWAAEGMISGDFTWRVGFETERFAAEYGAFINLEDQAVVNPAQWYADNLSEPWMKAAQDELDNLSLEENSHSNPIEQIRSLATIALRNSAVQMMNYILDRNKNAQRVVLVSTNDADAIAC